MYKNVNPEYVVSEPSSMISKVTEPSAFCGLKHSKVELVTVDAGTGMSPKRHSPDIPLKLEPVTKTLVVPADEPSVG